MIKEFNVQYYNGSVWLHAATIYAASRYAALDLFRAEPNNPYTGMRLRCKAA